MNNEKRLALIEAGKDTARVAEAAAKLERRHRSVERRSNLLNDPAEFWAWRAYRELGLDPNREELTEAATLAVRLVAADALSGNLSRVAETLSGQALWLGALAARMASRAEGIPEGPDSDDSRVKYWKLALAAQRQAAQTLCSVAALSKLQGDGVGISKLDVLH